MAGGKTNIFFPDKLSPQGFLTDMILAQMRSKSEPFSGVEGLRAKIYGEDFSKVTENKLFFLHPSDKVKLLKETIPKTAKDRLGKFNNYLNDLSMRRYINFLNNMSPAQQAAMVPYIRLYTKTVQGKKDTVQGEKHLGNREIVFNKEYRIPNTQAGAGIFQNKGKGNAGIVDLSVTRDFQYYGTSNRFNVEISFFFDSFETFANGMQHQNLLGVGVDAFKKGKEELLGQDQGTGYISLIKKGSRRDKSGNPIREYLFLEYGYKFPDNIDPNLVDPTDRAIFEAQEKKELRINCFKHDFNFSETGEVNLKVSYVAAPDSALASRDEEKTNDVFLIKNRKIIEEIMDENPATKNLNLTESLKRQLRRLKDLDNERKELLQKYCPDEEGKKVISAIDEKIQELSKLINSEKRALIGYIEHFFLKYFMKKNSLWNLSFVPRPVEHEEGVLAEPRVVFGQDGAQAAVTTMFLNKVSTTDAFRKEYKISCNHKEKIKQLKEKGNFAAKIDDSYFARGSVKKVPEIEKRLGKAKDILGSDRKHEAYAYYEAIQTFTLSRLAAQEALAQTGLTTEEVGLGDQEGAAAVNKDGTGFKDVYGNISFFPLKALVAAAIDFTIDEKEDVANFPIICLGNVLTDSMGEEYYTNLGDLLVDVDFFKEWLYKNFIDMEKFDPTLEVFMDKIFNSLVPSVLSAGLGHFSKGNHGFIGKQVYELDSSAYGDKKLFQDLVSENEKTRDSASKKLAKSIKSPSKKDEVKRPLVIYYQETFNDPNDKKQAKSSFLRKFGERNFNKKKDYEDGIYHVMVGQSSGIVRGINFSYIADPYLNTLFSMRNPNHLAAYLRYSYSADVEFVGNDLFFGKTAYFAIPKNQFSAGQSGLTGLSDPNKDVFGLSGYYQISKTTDTISMGIYSTSVTAKNMFSPAIEEAKRKKCPNKTSLDSPGNNTSTDGEKPIGIYVEHDIVKYIDKAFKSVPDLRERFNIKVLTKEEKEARGRKNNEA